MAKGKLDRFTRAVEDPTNADDVKAIVAAALRVEEAWYDDRGTLATKVFHLRKALEGIWGHDLPVMDDTEDPCVEE